MHQINDKFSRAIHSCYHVTDFKCFNKQPTWDSWEREKNGRGMKKKGTQPCPIMSLFLQVFTTQFSGWEIKQAGRQSSGGWDELVMLPELSESLARRRGGSGIREREKGGMRRWWRIWGGMGLIRQVYSTSVFNCASHVSELKCEWFAEETRDFSNKQTGLTLLRVLLIMAAECKCTAAQLIQVNVKIWWKMYLVKETVTRNCNSKGPYEY